MKCSCGLYHYTFDHWSKIHGQSKQYIDPLIQLPFVNGEVWNKNEYDPTTPYPLITYKWVCQFCGQGQGHDNDCDFRLNYPEFFKPLKGERKWEIPYYPVKSSAWNFDDRILEWEKVWFWWFKRINWKDYFNEPAAPQPTPPRFSYVPPRGKPKKPTQPRKEDDENTKRTLAGWNKVGKITFRQWRKLVKTVDPQA